MHDMVIHKKVKVICFRATEDDQLVIARLRKRLGVRAVTEIVRQALRCLDNKEK